jgi:dTDP-4-amino-4,6-dideoxygalactose transaminase
VFCDIDINTFNIDVDKIKPLISDKTKAIMPVHIYGQPSDIKPILEIASDHNLHVIFDACQALGAEYSSKKVGQFGDMECFSFYPTKNITTGEGGMITTNSAELAKRILSIRNHGRQQTSKGYEHHRLGYNYRTTDISSAIGIEQLKKLPSFLKKRRKNAKFLNENLRKVETPFVLKNSIHSFHQYTIKIKDRKEIIKELRNNKIGYGIYYPKPLHFYNHLKKYGHNDLKNSEKVSNEVLSLPVHPGLNENDLEKIVSVF